MDNFVIAADRDSTLVAPIAFLPAFELTIEFEPARLERTAHGERIMRKAIGGALSGRIAGAVYSQGGGEYSLRRTDGVVDLSGHIMMQDAKEEWLYLHYIGYQREDGYWRSTAWIDVDVGSEHNWVLGLFFVGAATTDNSNNIKIAFAEVG